MTTLNRVFGFSVPMVAAAALCGGISLAQAATGYTISQDQEGLVRQGMKADEVQATLGRPYQRMQYRNHQGPTFTYRVTDIDATLFEVIFNADGTVASARERMDPLLRQ